MCGNRRRLPIRVLSNWINPRRKIFRCLNFSQRLNWASRIFKQSISFPSHHEIRKLSSLVDREKEACKLRLLWKRMDTKPLEIIAEVPWIGFNKAWWCFCQLDLIFSKVSWMMIDFYTQTNIKQPSLVPSKYILKIMNCFRHHHLTNHLFTLWWLQPWWALRWASRNSARRKAGEWEG